MILTEEIKNKMYELYFNEYKNIVPDLQNVYTEYGFFKMSHKLPHYYQRAIISLRKNKLESLKNKLYEKVK